MSATNATIATIVVRVTIANIDAPTLARTLSSFGFSGTITSSLGFGEWGTESGVTLESATVDPRKPDGLLHVIADILTVRGEQCAYVTFNGTEPSLLYPTLHATTGRCEGFTVVPL